MNPVYIFKQASAFGPGLSYSKGTHRVPDQVLKHHYFQKLLKAGLVVQAGVKDAPVEPVSQIEQQKKAVEVAKVQASEKLQKFAAEDKIEEEAKPKKSKK